MTRSKIIITRAFSVLAYAKKYKIELDGILVAELKNGETVAIAVNEGTHSLSFIAFGKCEKSITVAIGENTAPISIKAKLVGSNSRIELQTNNNDSIISDSKNTALLSNSNDRSSVSTINLICILIFIATIFLVFVIVNNATTEKNIDIVFQGKDLTPAEKAEQILQAATEAFETEDYMKAIHLCNKIVAEYPTTEYSKNMPDYLYEQYSKFENITASRLMKEYTENIVNADKKYNNRILLIDGVVDSIAKTNNGNNLCVLLKSNTYFSSVQLNFDTDQENAVSQLNTGHKIRVIGECTGKSGKQFAIFDSNNVMIENCYIIY